MGFDVALSIIIPAYNVERYIVRCLDSVLCYEWNIKIEVIIINDGSIDKTGEICKEYKDKYSNVRYFEIENAGLSNARNMGIMNANGTYISFLDSDDYIDASALESIVKEGINKDVDIIVGEWAQKPIKNDWQVSKRTFLHEGVYDSEEFLLVNLEKNTMRMCVPFNVYRRKLICENECIFKINIIHEDELWTPQIFLLANSLLYLNRVFYYVINRSNSITTATNQEKPAYDLLSICLFLKTKYDSETDGRLKIELLDYLARLYLGAYRKGKLYLDKTVDRDFPMNNASRNSTKFKSYLLKINGRIFYAFYSIFLKLKRTI